MILDGDDADPSMKYEDLYRFSFDNCRKQEDPWEEATQYNYAIFMKNDLSEAKASLYRILHKLIFDNFKNTFHIKSKLLEIEKKINLINSQEDAIEIIENTLFTIEKN